MAIHTRLIQSLAHLEWRHCLIDHHPSTDPMERAEYLTEMLQAFLQTSLGQELRINLPAQLLARQSNDLRPQDRCEVRRRLRGRL